MGSVGWAKARLVKRYTHNATKIHNSYVNIGMRIEKYQIGGIMGQQEFAKNPNTAQWIGVGLLFVGMVATLGWPLISIAVGLSGAAAKYALVGGAATFITGLGTTLVGAAMNEGETGDRVGGPSHSSEQDEDNALLPAMRPRHKYELAAKQARGGFNKAHAKSKSLIRPNQISATLSSNANSSTPR